MSRIGASAVLFFIAVTGLYVLPVLSRELVKPGFGAAFGLLLVYLVCLVTAVGAFVAVIRRRHSRPKWVVRGAVVLLTLWLPACATGSLGKLGDRLYFERREAALRGLVARIEHYGTIESMSDGRRYYKEVNGALYRGPGSNPVWSIYSTEPFPRGLVPNFDTKLRVGLGTILMLFMSRRILPDNFGHVILFFVSGGTSVVEFEKSTKTLFDNQPA